MDLQTLRDLAQKSIQAGPPNLKKFREEHLHLFAKNGFLTTHPDFYKFTNIESAIRDVKYDSQDNKCNPREFEDKMVPTIYLINGKIDGPIPETTGIKISVLTDDFSKLDQSKNRINSFTHLHHSLMEQGILIEVSKDAQIKSPLRVLNFVSNATMNTATIILRARTNSEVTLIEETYGLSPEYTNISESHLIIEAGAKVEHIQIEAGSFESIHHGSTFSHVAKDATYRNIVFHLSGKLNRRNLDLNLQESGAHGESYNLYLTHKNEKSDINTAINHFAADSTSSQIAKGILDEESKGIFTGLIHIYPQAQRVASGQLNKNLLLSNKAQAHSQPQLEIFADDVKCAHGSTTGQLSEDELFYFEARGIPREKARTLLAHGFGMEIVLKIQNLVARERMSALVLEKMKSKFKIGGT